MVHVLKKSLHKRIYLPIMDLLKQGLTPDRLALSLACGVMIGVFPIWGTTTLLCIFIGSIFRLNHIALQTANYGVYPLQFVFMIPFIRLGETIFNKTPVPLHPDRIAKLAEDDLFDVLISYGNSFVYGSIAWLLVCIPMVFILKKIFLAVLKMDVFMKRLDT